MFPPLSTIFLCIFILPCYGRPLRVNEAECAARRCCLKRDEVMDSPLQNGLCENLSDEECGEKDEFCIWDCHPDDHRFGGKRGVSFSRRFRGISAMVGDYEEVERPGPEIAVDNTFDECMASGRSIDRDDCGVEYEDTMDEELLRRICSDKSENSHSTTGQHGTDDSQNVTTRRDVLGTDDRQWVQPWLRDLYPIPAVKFLTYRSMDGRQSFRCTASMISPHWAITAAHCVYGRGDWYKNWKLYKDVSTCSDRNKANSFIVDYAVIFCIWMEARTTNARFNWDIALLRLHKDAGNQVGYFEVGWSNEFSGTINFNIISYPADKPQCTKWRQYCPYSQWDGDHQQVTYECDTYGGASGSPVFKYEAGLAVIYAIHTNGACYDKNKRVQNYNVCNLATRITKSKYNSICKYLNRDTKNRCSGI